METIYSEAINRAGRAERHVTELMEEIRALTEANEALRERVAELEGEKIALSEGLNETLERLYSCERDEKNI